GADDHQRLRPGVGDGAEPGPDRVAVLLGGGVRAGVDRVDRRRGHAAGFQLLDVLGEVARHPLAPEAADEDVAEASRPRLDRRGDAEPAGGGLVEPAAEVGGVHGRRGVGPAGQRGGDQDGWSDGPHDGLLVGWKDRGPGGDGPAPADHSTAGGAGSATPPRPAAARGGSWARGAGSTAAATSTARAWSS